MLFFSTNQFNQRSAFSGGGGWGCLIVGVVMLIGLFYFLKWLFDVLWIASPFLLALALIINWRAVADTGKGLVSTLERNPISGLFMAALAVVLFPFFSLYLVFKALGYNKIKEMKAQFGEQTNNPFGQGFDPFRPEHRPADEYAEYEELESTPKNQGETKEKPIEPPLLPEKEPERKDNKKSNPYDQMFE